MTANEFVRVRTRDWPGDEISFGDLDLIPTRIFVCRSDRKVAYANLANRRVAEVCLLLTVLPNIAFADPFLLSWLRSSRLHHLELPHQLAILTSRGVASLNE